MRLRYRSSNLKRFFVREKNKNNRRATPVICVGNPLRCLAGIICALLVSLLCLISSSMTYAASSSNPQKLIEYLAQEKTNLTIELNQVSTGSTPADQAQLNMRKRQKEAMLGLNRIKIGNLENFLVDQHGMQEKLNQRLKNLQQSSLVKNREITPQEQISKINTLKEVNKKAIELIKDTLELAERYQQKLTLEMHQLNVWQAKFDAEHKLEQLRNKIASLDAHRDNLYQKTIALQQQRESEERFQDNVAYEAALLLNNQQILLLQDEIQELELQKRLIKADYTLLKNSDVKTLKVVTDVYRNALEQLRTIQASLNKMFKLLENQPLIEPDTQLKKTFELLQSKIKSRIKEVDFVLDTIEDNYKQKQQQLKKQVSLRQDVSSYQIQNWPNIAHEFIHMPGQFYQYLKILALKLKENYEWLDAMQTVIFWVSIFFILIVVAIFRQILKAVTQDKERSKLSAHLYDGILVLLYRNIPHLTAIAILFATCFLTRIPLVNYKLLVHLFAVWLIFRNIIILARLTLLERVSDVSGKDVTLYYRLKWLLLAGGWSTALMVFSHLLPLSPVLQDLFNRLFMLFLLAISIVMWTSKDVIPYLLRPILKSKKKYIRTAIRVLVTLIPLTLFTTAVIGMIGYINLAWQMSRYQAYLLMMITGYVLARGLLIDLLEFISEWMISSMRNGWLWIEVFLKPLDRIARISLILISFLFLFQLYGWHADSWIVRSLKQIGHYPFIHFSGIHITLFSTIEFLILLFIFIWAAKWTREFCYRWLYKSAKDAGIRNSLSVFTQYAVILIGSFITLRVLGLDFSGMSMVLGGLAVGMGFGLRDFASNIIGGIMLLIERPVREGDLITLGEYEGRVAHIGIRSMRVSSWDNMEVLIPNAETFNKPFTNWTHQDYVVRTVIPIKVGRGDDPLMVQRLILDVLNIIPEILSEPPPQVFLKQIDEALIEFEARYFINVEEHTRFEVRSTVLFAITAQFKAAGIKPPIPPFSVELKESESDYALTKKPAEK